MTRLWILALLGLIAALGIACSDESEDVPAGTGDASSTPTGSPAPTTSPTNAGLTSPTATIVVGSTSPAPEGWSTYIQPPSDKTPTFSVSYPGDWFVYGGDVTAEGTGLGLSLYSFDRITWGQIHSFPPESMKVEIGVALREGLSSCGTEGGESVTVAGVSGQRVTESFEPPHASGLTKSIVIAATKGQYCDILAASFAQKSPDEETFSKIVDNFTLSD